MTDLYPLTKIINDIKKILDTIEHHPDSKEIFYKSLNRVYRIIEEVDGIKREIEMMNKRNKND
jgi:hypothetical protein